MFLTVVLPDAKNPKVNVDPNGTFTFSASGGADNNLYELKLDLLDKINVEVRCFSHCLVFGFLMVRGPWLLELTHFGSLSLL